MNLFSKIAEKYRRSPKDRTEIHVLLAFIVIPFVGMSLFAAFVFIFWI